MTFSLKSIKLILLTFAMVMVVVITSQQVEARSTWCLCGDLAQTKVACEISKGNWDGGSCGLDDKGRLNNFQKLCNRTSSLKYRCWE
ncbi:hypothetical protein BGX23_001327 [Mortierella sp. AD031]|nr:hypothetical protein BGX23_001327 [Mortierella sp. AD031]KAG0214229.1 hypothetical protein BGX33_002306 [Mortierella sp. NVP41]